MSSSSLLTFESDREDDEEEDNNDGLLQQSDRNSALVSSSPSIMRRMKNQDPFDILLKAYMKRLETNPVLTKVITSSIVSALGALLGHMSTKRRTNRQSTTSLQQLSEICSFALYGGLVGGPITHYWNQWLEDQNTNGERKLSTSWKLLIDQIIAQPPMLFLMHVVLDMAGAAVQELPKAWSRSYARSARSVVSSWRFWPAAVYIILYVAKKKRHATLAMQVASIYWMSKVARQRGETQPLSQTVR